MVFFFNLSITLVFLASKSHTFINNRLKPLSLNKISRRHGFSSGFEVQYDQPFILTQCAEPGKEDELVISDRQTHGINKIISDINRRNSRNDPVFPVGSIVCVKKGRFLRSKGTVLFNKPMGIGEPYQVLVALDCRNSEGLVKEELSMEHGTGVWFLENELYEYTGKRKTTTLSINLDWIPYSKYPIYKATKIYNNYIRNSVKYEEIVRLYNEAVGTGNEDCYTASSALIQVARGLNDLRTRCLEEMTKKDPKIISFQKMVEENVDPEFLETLVEKIEDDLQKKQIDPSIITWILWSVGKLKSFNLKLNNFKKLYHKIEKKINNKFLKELSQYCLTNLLVFYNCYPECIKNLDEITNIALKIPKDEISTLLLNQLIGAYEYRKTEPQSLLKYLEEFIIKHHYKIGKSDAIAFLRNVKDYENFSKEATDRLYSIVFSVEDDTRRRIIDSRDFYNLLVASLGDKEMFELFSKNVYNSECILEPHIILKSLLVLSRTSYNKMKIWMLDKAISNIEYFSYLELGALLHKLVYMNNVPKELAKAIYTKSKTLLLEGLDRSSGPNMLRFLNKHPYGSQEDVLETLEILSSRYNEYSFLSVFIILENLLPLSKKFNVDIYRSFPKYVENLILEVKSYGRFHVTTFGYMLYYISEVAAELFDRAANVAVNFKNTGQVSLENVDRPTLALAQMIYTVLVRFSGNFNNHQRIQIIKFQESQKEKEGTAKTQNFSYHISDPKLNCQWSTVYLYLSVRAGYINRSNFPREKVMRYLSPLKKYLTNYDLTFLKRSLEVMGLVDPMYDEFMKSVPKGIDVVEEISFSTNSNVRYS